MEIFIGNLPRYAAVSHLNRFFAGYGRVAKFQIYEKTLDDGRVVRYGHGIIEPEIAAQRAIAHLRGKRLLGCPLEIRRYVKRTGRERRITPQGMGRFGRELRKGDERRFGLSRGSHAPHS